MFDGDERGGELTVIQTAFHADPHIRLGHTGSGVWCAGRRVTPANTAPGTDTVREKGHFILK